MKDIVVQKFGGTSVADVSCIENVADLVLQEKEAGNHVVVVVSAMAGVTDDLVNKVNQIAAIDNENTQKEYDVAMASGEQVSSALLALMLQKKGYKSRSWLSWQLPIISDSNYGKSDIISINTEKIVDALRNDEVPVIAGFQGVCDNRITTMGRGGSDTTAASIAAALSAKRCDIYTDVNGIFTADPNIVKDAKKLDSISYEEMLELSSLGARVLNTKSVEMAMKYKVPLRVLSSFEKDSGTVFITDSHNTKNKKLITAITHSVDEARITVEVPLSKGVTPIFTLLAEHKIKIDMIVQNVSKDKKLVDLTFTTTKSDLAAAIVLMQKHKKLLSYTKIEQDVNVSKVSVVGVGMKNNCTIAQQMFEALSSKNIEVMLISTSEIKISVLIQEEYTELALRTLHAKFNL